MQLRAINHVAFLVSDVQRSRYFYNQVLNLEELQRPAEFDFPGGWFGGEVFQVHLIEDQEGGRVAKTHPGYRADEVARGRAAHVAFEVSDLDATVQQLQAKNVEIMGGLGHVAMECVKSLSATLMDT